MKIGYSVEGSTDRALLSGLKHRWCPAATLLEGLFRGQSQQSLRREYKQICEEFAIKDVDVMVFLTDGNGNAWRGILQNERDKFPGERLAFAVHGVPDRNVECWICLDADYTGAELGVPPQTLRVADPKAAFETAMGVTSLDRREKEIAELVRRAPLKTWLRDESFEHFYEQIRDFAQRHECHIPNVRELPA